MTLTFVWITWYSQVQSSSSCVRISNLAHPTLPSPCLTKMLQVVVDPWILVSFLQNQDFTSTPLPNLLPCSVTSVWALCFMMRIKACQSSSTCSSHLTETGRVSTSHHNLHHNCVSRPVFVVVLNLTLATGASGSQKSFHWSCKSKTETVILLKSQARPKDSNNWQ